RGLSADGRCRAFSVDASGFGPAEGVGVLVVERLSDAQRRGHRVLAVIRGSAVNQDGASNGLTAPNGPSQQRVIRRALADAGLSVDDVDVVEAHGTGTPLGDPIEAQALLATYGQRQPGSSPLLLGSVKSNIGHTQSASGIAGVMKMVMALQHGVVPPTLHVSEPTREVDWSRGAVELVTEVRPWPRDDRPGRAGISSFGVSGTNAHLIVEQAPAPVPGNTATATGAGADVAESQAPVLAESTAAADAVGAGVGGSVFGGVFPWVLSGRTPAALRAQAGRLAHALHKDFPVDASGRPDLGGIGVTLARHRARFEHRAAVLARTPDGALTALRALESGQPAADVITTTSAGAGGVGPVFVFPGQGSQWVGMGRALLETSPVFTASVQAVEEALAPYVDWSLTAVLRQEQQAPALDRDDVVQPALFAVMVALADLWRHHGIRPAAVIGHSQGEIAAAHVAGALTLQDAARLVALRSQALARIAGNSTLATIAMGSRELGDLLARWEGRLSTAAVNSPRSTVVAGDTTAVRELLQQCRDDGIRARLIPVNYASHSPHVETVARQLQQQLADITPATTSDITFCSTVTGRPLDTTELDAEYWYRNLRQTVQFQQATETLLDTGHNLFIEVSPHPGLTMAIEQTAEAKNHTPAVLESLHRDDGTTQDFLTALTRTHTHGIEPAWDTVFPHHHTPIDLPTYAFQHKRYW
ncbi:type I polyketide synthase, partial [Streptomyces ipomoeae]